MWSKVLDIDEQHVFRDHDLLRKSRDASRVACDFYGVAPVLKVIAEVVQD